MKMLSLSLSSAMALSLCACAAATAANPPASDLAAFPAAVAGQTRHVIHLPAQADEDLAKVEIIVGRTMRIDCNNHFFGGEVHERTAEGWGYSYYVLDSLGNAASTMMGCPPGSERDAFVRSSQQRLVRYNSRLPLMIYAPDDVEVRYRVWRAEAEQSVR